VVAEVQRHRLSAPGLLSDPAGPRANASKPRVLVAESGTAALALAGRHAGEIELLLTE
jgi:hypothetical protein